MQRWDTLLEKYWTKLAHIQIRKGQIRNLHLAQLGGNLTRPILNVDWIGLTIFRPNPMYLSFEILLVGHCNYTYIVGFIHGTNYA